MPTLRKPTTKDRGSSSRNPAVKSCPLLIEIGTEEIPTKFFPQALLDFRTLGEQLMTECRLNYEQIRTVGTCRRLVLLVDGVHSQQSSVTQEVIGPPKSAGFDAAGEPTKAAKGFAASQGVPVERLTVKETPRGLYLTVTKHEAGQSAKQVLTASLPGYLAKLSFPKAMRWNASQTKFARPIRWLVVLLDHQALKIEFGGIHSGRVTRGHRSFRSKNKKDLNTVSLKSAGTYLKDMKKFGVLVDPDERRVEIMNQVNALAKVGKGRIDPVSRQELIEEAVWGVEYPHAILGTFQNEFLALPKPVLISSMKEHQGFLSLVGKDERLLPRFVAVTNSPAGNTPLMRKGNERVLSARLKDAQYFFQDDEKRSLSDRVPSLAGVMFHHKLGTMLQKVERIRDLAGWLAQSIGPHDSHDVCRRAALLSKADLMTGMVGEFPSLQGVMGEEYARHDGEPQEVCQAIGEHYLPRFPDDHLPASLPGMLVSCADRCDSIAAFFAVRMAPSGSEDPLGLRRAAFGLIRILGETALRLNLIDVFEQIILILGKQGVNQAESKVVSEIMGFLMERLRFYGRNNRGFREDVMDAVIRVRPSDTADIGDLLSRMHALQEIVDQPDFATLMVGFKRTHRIVEKERWSPTGVIPDLFQDESEYQLFQVLEKVQQELDMRMTNQDYAGVLRMFMTFRSPIDSFFSAVMVNDPEPSIRENRLSLLTRIDHLFLALADFSCIQSVGIEVG